MLIEKFVAILLISKYLNIRLSQARFYISKDTRNIVTNNPVQFAIRGLSNYFQ